METAFTPWSALLGGLLIGAASVGLMAIHGRIAGISGLLGKLLPPFDETGPLSDKTALGFVVGLLIALPLYVLATGADISVWMPSSVLQIIIAGLITGIGVVVGNGCTSGHGVCGISRLSTRSIIGTCIFLASGVVTVTIMRHVIGG